MILAATITLALTAFCVVWALIFNFNPIDPSRMNPLFNLLWTAFAGLGLVVAAQGTFKTLPNMLLSAACGPVYGVAFFGLLGFFLGMGIPTIVAFGLCALIVTYLLALVHVVFLKDTVFNMVAFTLGTYGIWFALKDNANPANMNWFYGAFFFLIGTAYGTIIGPIAVFIFKKTSTQEAVQS
ncbi:MAG: hypothetical protein A2Z99_19550 [Treponema sp. GWB1_62_6]|nr:MAG: hypothetical protein A2001_12010 [Treponema sp. GWC1_61_84]OHE72242.1 MAG: hypothetical protein A2Z99_19550 [Treponema sp. GWB1_62_6]